MLNALLNLLCVIVVTPTSKICVTRVDVISQMQYLTLFGKCVEFYHL